MIIAGTGHRPKRILIGDKNAYDKQVFKRLVDLACVAVERKQPETIISGMAQGFDTALAIAAIELDIPLWAYLPFEGQANKWPRKSQALHRHLLEKADFVHVCCEGGYASWKMMRRNEELVEDCDLLLALWSGEPSGTANAVQYAQRTGKQTINLWPIWEQYAGRTDV